MIHLNDGCQGLAFLQVGEWEVDKEIIPVVEFCISRHMTTWLGMIYAYKGLLLVRTSVV